MNFKKMYKLSLAFLTIFALTCFAPSSSLAQENGNGFFPFISGGLDYQLTHMKYKESKMSEEGYLNGVHGWVAWHLPSVEMMFKLEAEASVGTLDYDGETLSGIPLTSSGDSQLMNVRFQVGKDFMLNQNVALTPYLGLALRYWCDDQDYIGAYKRETTYALLPLGLEFTCKPQEKVKLVFNAEYDFFLYGKNKSHLSDLHPAFNNITFDQNSGYGFRMSGKMIWDLGTIALSVEPFFRYFDIDKSESGDLTYYGHYTGLTFYEPDNDTTIWGIRLGVEF